MAIALGAGAPSLQAVVFVAPLTAIPLMLFSGFLIRMSSIPAFLRWLQWVSYFHYSFEGCLVAIYEGVNDYALEEIGFNNAQTSTFGFSIGLLIVFFIVFKIGAYVILRRKAKRVY